MSVRVMHNCKSLLTIVVLLAASTLSVNLHAQAEDPSSPSNVHQADVVVYGATPAGITAAIAAAKRGWSVALVDLNAHVGGVVSGGLVHTDVGDRTTIGGLANEFFERVGHYYAKRYGSNSKEFKASRNGVRFEPHVAELVFEQMLTEQPLIKIWRNCRYRSVVPTFGRSDGSRRIEGLVVDDRLTQTQRTFSGKIFIDASYEGDLMAGARVPYRVGREARSEYNEFLAGINMGPADQRGLGDHRTMRYNYRISLTFNTQNRVLFPKPERYDPSPFVNSYGKAAIGGRARSIGDFFTTIDKALPGDKFDANWFGLTGNSLGYAEGSWETRDRIAASIRDNALSALWYMQNDPSLPESFRAESRKWGLPKDEFVDNGHFPFQLYVRVARRMVGSYVLREQDLTQDRWKSDGIATGSYGIDCHVVQLVRDAGGRLVPEHTRHVPCDPYDIPYRSLISPQVDNLLVPVCVSASHVAYCSLRMEPVYMMLGQAAGNAAHLALASKKSVHDVDTSKLRRMLLRDGAVLDAGYQPQFSIRWSPRHPRANEAVTFRIVTEKTNRKPFKQTLWDFTGDGSVSASEDRAVHSFATEKVHSVSALVIDTDGRKRLLAVEVPVGRAVASDVTVDDLDADLRGAWSGGKPDRLPGLGRYSDIHLGPGIRRDEVPRSVRLGIGDAKGSPVLARFQPEIPKAGRYRVCLGFRPSKSQASNVTVFIRHAEGTARLAVDQRKDTTPFIWHPLGDFHFKAGKRGLVHVSNEGANGRIAVDGMRWVYLGE